MWTLHQFPLCPFSRKVRLLLGEKGVGFDMKRENPWEARDEFQMLNPALRTPVLTRSDRALVLIDSRAIAEYFEETIDKAPMINGTAATRAEIRRLVALFDENFFAGVTAPLLEEKMKKRLFSRLPPDAKALRQTIRLANDYLDYVDYLIDTRPWLAGSTISLADLTAAAQISVADYLGGIDWAQHEPARGWYSALKSRPSFRPLLTERMDGITPPDHYGDVNA